MGEIAPWELNLNHQFTGFVNAEGESFRVNQVLIQIIHSGTRQGTA
jgi:hypothetical protein